MTENGIRKRDLLKAGIFASLAAPSWAQSERLFGARVPKELLRLLPTEPIDIMRMVDTIIRLERDADREGLPQSPLQLHKGEREFVDENSLYQLALPRLVALIDRSEQFDIGIADRAGSLLAKLHAAQHELPEALLNLPTLFSATDEAVFATRLASLQLQVPSLSLPSILNSAPETTNTDDPVALSKAKDFASLKPEYAQLFQSALVRPEHKESTDWYLVMMQKSKARYQPVSENTGVPWHFIAVCHALESSFNFRAHLHNGDFPLSARTRQVPAGRPAKWLPPSDWESSARDALRLLGFAGQKDWSLERTLYRLEAFNGFGYRPHGVASPYLWSFSNHYDRGKYTADRKWSASAKSQQCGAAVMLRLLTDAGEIDWPQS